MYNAYHNQVGTCQICHELTEISSIFILKKKKEQQKVEAGVCL